ncbi:MAG: PGPGW domain-containing protein [Solirubrobacteraceae bacterium]|nr:PGPGW domain-containing protein [Solirubrobacteraceae bacterium]
MKEKIREFHLRLQAQQDAHKERSFWLRTVGVVVGIALLPLGVILIPLPGPGVGIILAGLAILSLEFHWLRKLLDKVMPLIAGHPNRDELEPPPADRPRESDLP